MRTKVMSALITLTFAMSSTSHAGGRELFGRIFGGLLGGKLCDEMGIGQGNGRTAAIALCAIGGSMIGGEIGKDMDEADARAYQEIQERSFYGELDQDYDWDGRRYGSRTGIHGRLRPIGEGYHYQTHEQCREYTSYAYRGNRSSENRSIVCRRSDGSFYSLEQKSLYINGRLVESRTRETVNRPVRPGRRVPPPQPPRKGGGGDSRWGSDPRACQSWNIDFVRRGDVVYTRYGQRGTFDGLGRSGLDAAVNIKGFSQIMQTRDIALGGCQLGIEAGSLVTTRYGQHGIVAGVFQNGDVAVQINGYIQVLRRDDLYF